MRVMVAIDGSAGAWHALEEAMRTLPLTDGRAHVDLVAVAPFLTTPADPMTYGVVLHAPTVAMREEARRHLAAAEKALTAAGVASTSHLREGDAAEAILALARQRRPDLLVVGSHGRGAMGRLVIGSVSEALLHRWHGPVMVVRRPDDALAHERPRDVASVMTAAPHVIGAEAPVAAAAALMREADVGFLPVVRQGALAGVITDRDLAVRVLADGLDPAKVSVGEACTADVAFVTPELPVEEAVRLMERHRVRRLVVMDRGRIAGVVSLGDLAETVPRTAEHALVEISRSPATLAHGPAAT